ncbi:sulfatase/phosphatase domain-containing protein, partial [Anaerotruncus massiliensis (ex Liu et al. 2021)]|uniref:sulfatase/phosphatase domain-containing protein n=1 Tax=Anaerotruncus massiliensis (ex Liu et al. 2021) TaxID=2321404 RepID=UPI003AB34943
MYSIPPAAAPRAQCLCRQVSGTVPEVGSGNDEAIDFWELYDLKKDVMEVNNVYDNPKYVKVREVLTVATTLDLIGPVGQDVAQI